MASTNQTTHYDLSQYVASDKPTYLVDYNGDMAKIDAGIYSADSLARTNESSIGTLSNLDTTVKSDLVSAINEVNTQVGLNTTAIGNNTTAIGDNTTAIGVLANLNTTVKSDLVSATNEVNSKVGTLSNLTTNEKGSTVGAINEVNYNVGLFNLTNFTDVTPNLSSGSLTSGQLHIATNGDGSIAKIYGTLNITRDGNARCIITASSPLRPESNITINCMVNRWAGNNKNYGMFDLQIATDGTITIDMYDGVTNQNADVYIIPCLLFIKDFGDQPTPPSN